MRIALFVFLASSVALLGAAGSAHACSFIMPYVHETDPTIADRTPPSPPVVEEVRITRGQSPGYYGGSSCDDSGVIVIAFQPGKDDMAAPYEIGYRLTRLGGTLPDGFWLPEVAVRPEGPLLVLPWIDGATDDQEAFAATVGITAIDRAGNESIPTIIEIADQGSGCSTYCTRDTVSPTLVLAGLALARVRRQGRP